ncbi:hypothetical protein SCHPADRAFT_996820 [Schizopora paradoxa]|uniref:F-box domain-containing protein n=1 Tax=Schizopora paradoxa TaxID=27342 RepID=A0A0H2RR75_9AGAM|nr:hypothetical protein SCHPADRAFT_996820 [Schizopora paradoxa]
MQTLSCGLSRCDIYKESHEHVESGFRKTRLGAASISSLIPDVLREIFEHGCSIPATFIPDTRMTVAPALVYSQVCRSWRSLALTQSTLWSLMIWGSCWWYGGDTRNWTDPHERFAALWDLYLLRSRQALLDVSLFLFEYDAPELRKHLLDSIFKEQHRFQRLYLICDGIELPEGKAYLLTSAAPELSILKITCKIYNETLEPAPLNKTITVDLSGFTSLRELQVDGHVLLRGQVPANVLDSLRTLTYWNVTA